MREIKFRCWQVDEFDEDDKPIKWEMIPADCLAFEEYEPLIDLLESNEHKILMQYTGLKDKNGKEIYEGDILKGITGYIFNIVFINGSFCMQSDTKHPIPNGNFIINGTDCKLYEIIGNIYENPELVNQKP